MERRKFLRTSGIFAAGFYASKFRAIAGPFEPGEWARQVPYNKKIDPEWIKSLYKRGQVTKYLKSKNELKYIGMPVGGIATGTLYLGGDGRLWLWDIFNANQEGIEPKEVAWTTSMHDDKKVRSRDGVCYIAPAHDIRPLEQGFAFKIEFDGKTVIKKMEAEDWDEVVFEAAYPVGRITYYDNRLPVNISAEVFSPFIPLDDKNSGLPLTAYSFKIKNKTTGHVSVSIIGWLENKVCPSIKTAQYSRLNSAHRQKEMAGVECRMETEDTQLRNQPGFGSLGIACLNKGAILNTDFSLPVDQNAYNRANNGNTVKKADTPLLASVAAVVSLTAHEAGNLDFLISWCFPNIALNEIPDKNRFYGNDFSSASTVMEYAAANWRYLSHTTRLWQHTWYDSTLPWWFLERTFGNISCLATTTAYRMASGRFYAWEGVGCCAGTCTHVWQYAQAMGRIFPFLERDTRQRVDLGISYQPDGSMWYRGEADKRPAVDGQAGTILRFYREHQMNADSSFLQNNWNKIKQTILFLMSLDKNKDGMEDTPLENTLDAMWDGEISWIVSLCLAAVKAGEKMAVEMNDIAFAAQCNDYVQKGAMNMEEKLFNGEYFIHRPDAEKGRKRLGSYNTCHIDQVYGQSWAFQAGLGRILNKEKTVSALRSLWKYNFTPDVGPYIREHKGGRPYALEGEGGMIMNTNPANEPAPYGDDVTWQLGYFHECMSGFEHQVASHMMGEGMVEEAMVLTRMVHDRYHAAKRNPFNEIECSDHYARAMASYGTFITACGFEYHGPKGYMRFAPKIGVANFKAPFTAAEGWGSYTQKLQDRKLQGQLQIKYGSLKLNTFSMEIDHRASDIKVLLNGKPVESRFTQQDKDITIHCKYTVKAQVNDIIDFKVI